jgi:hypothetical protein
MNAAFAVSKSPAVASVSRRLFLIPKLDPERQLIVYPTMEEQKGNNVKPSDHE